MCLATRSVSKQQWFWNIVTSKLFRNQGNRNKVMQNTIDSFFGFVGIVCTVRLFIFILWKWIAFRRNRIYWPLCLSQLFCLFRCKLYIQRVEIRDMWLWIGKMKELKGSDFLLGGYLMLVGPKEMTIWGCSCVLKRYQSDHEDEYSLKWNWKVCLFQNGLLKMIYELGKKEIPVGEFTRFEKDVSLSCNPSMIFMIR